MKEREECIFTVHVNLVCVSILTSLFLLQNNIYYYIFYSIFLLCSRVCHFLREFIVCYKVVSFRFLIHAMARLLNLLLLLSMAAQAAGLLPPQRACRLSRRAAMRTAALLTTSLAPPLHARAIDASGSFAEIDPGAFERINGGGRYTDVKVGTGPTIAQGSKVSLQWVLRRSNGYYVDGSVKMLSAQSGAVRVADNFDEANNFLFTVGDGQAMPGVDEGVRGMKQGGIRRLVLPVKQAYTLPVDKSPGPLPDGYGPRRQIERELQRQDPYNYFYLEVEATRVR